MNRVNQSAPSYAQSSPSRNAGGLSGAVSNIVERLLFRPVKIVGVETWADRFRAISMEGAAFKGMKWVPGQTIQLFLGNLTKRAYTPVEVSPTDQTALFLCYIHGHGPGSSWAATAKVGDSSHVMRPKESIDLAKCVSPTLLFGDETSLSTAQALQGFAGGSIGSNCVFEVDSISAASAVLERLEIFEAYLIERKTDGSHLREAAAQLSKTLKPADWIFTGNARSIQTVRKELKGVGIKFKGNNSRAYWSPSKTGLD